MEQVELPFFPYPIFSNHERHQGYEEKWARQCDTCDRQCEATKSKILSVCSYGISYQWVDNSILIFGVLMSSVNPTAATKKAIKNNQGRKTIKHSDLLKAIEGIAAHQKQNTKEIDEEKRTIIADYVSKNSFKVDFLEQMKPVIQRNLSFLHDYSQFVSSVKQNINVVLHSRYVGGDTESKLSRATEPEAAIYWSSVLMSEKLTTAFLLLHPERLASMQKSTFKLHGLILKYIRIYNAAYKDKQVRLDVTGVSNGQVKADSSVLSVIPHTLLDNALKYSRAGSKVVVSFEETWSTIIFSVTSLGPKIDDDERDRIFDIFYRGRHAAAQEDGSGLGYIWPNL